MLYTSTANRALSIEDFKIVLVEYCGSGWLDLERGCTFGPETVVLFEHAGGNIKVTAKEQGVRFLLLSGRPLGEPVAWQGPIVMNTREELMVAFEEYHAGTFVK